MKKYYVVCSSFYSNGRISANLVDVIEAEEKPQDTHNETRKCDIYVNYFESHEEAMDYIKKCKVA